MKIKAKIALIDAFVLLLTIAFSAVVLVAYQDMKSKLDQTRRLDGAVGQLFALNLALSNYELGEGERARHGWRVSSQRLQRYLRDLHDSARSAPLLTTRLLAVKAEIDALHRALPQPPRPSAQAESTVSDAIRAKLHEMLHWTEQKSAVMEADLSRAQRITGLAIVLYALSTIGVMVGMYFFFRRTVLRPLARLERGAQRVGRGEFDHRLNHQTSDEFAHVAAVFNEMTANLRRLTRARDEFISTAVHEIKTPIAVLKTAVQLAQRQSPQQLAERAPELLARLDRQCNRLNRLVTDVLDVSRLELQRTRLDLRPTDMEALVERVVHEMQPPGRDHDLLLRHNDPCELIVDSDRIEQVLINLIDNAIKYSPAGGDVEVASRRRDDDLVISVRDHGIGIPPDRQAHIFERFYRAHAGTAYDHVTSLGVGLYLSRQLIERHGGRMWFESEEGVGSTFSFNLPLDQPPGAVRGAGSAS